jgi:hypothetical protein
MARTGMNHAYFPAGCGSTSIEGRREASFALSKY